MRDKIYWAIQSALLGMLAACILTALVATFLDHQIYQYSIGIPFTLMAVITAVFIYLKINNSDF